MRRILVAVDGSETSNRACALAADMARRFGARLTLVHVIPPYPYPLEGYGIDFEALAKTDQKAAEALLQKAENAIKSPGLQTEQSLRWGSPADVLTEIAKDDDVDCVVVGSQGKGPMGRAFLGSTSNQLVHLCTKPVLVVR